MTVSNEQIYPMNPPKFDMVDDMAELTYLNEPSVIHNLTVRYKADHVYVNDRICSQYCFKLTLWLLLLLLDIFGPLFGCCESVSQTAYLLWWKHTVLSRAQAWWNASSHIHCGGSSLSRYATGQGKSIYTDNVSEKRAIMGGGGGRVIVSESAFLLFILFILIAIYL